MGRVSEGEKMSHYDEQREIDNVNNPKHYTDHPSGIECIQITEHMSFNLGNALKYIWRCDLKKDAIEDLKKARWYINREIEKREKLIKKPPTKWPDSDSRIDAIGQNGNDGLHYKDK
jgi:hypothetical protein